MCNTHIWINLSFFLSCMAGYINNSLSIARMGDESILKEFSASQMVTASGLNVSQCRFVLLFVLSNWHVFNQHDSDI